MSKPLRHQKEPKSKFSPVTEENKPNYSERWKDIVINIAKDMIADRVANIDSPYITVRVLPGVSFPTKSSKEE